MQSESKDEHCHRYRFRRLSVYLFFYIFSLPYKYSETALLRPPKIRISYLLKTLFAKFKLFFSSFSIPSVSLIRDHLWDCPKVVFKKVVVIRNFTVYVVSTC